MLFSNELVQSGDDLLASVDDVRPVFHQGVVPKGQEGRVGTFALEGAQLCVASGNHLGVRVQVAAILPVDLAEQQVQVLATRARGAGDEADVFRQKEDDGQNSQEVDGALAHAVDHHHLPQSRPASAPSLLGEDNPQAGDNSVAQDVAGDFRVGDGFLFEGQPVDEFSLRERAQGFAGGQVGNCFQQIRFTLGIASLDDRHALGKIQLQAQVVSEVLQRDVLQVHVFVLLQRPAAWQPPFPREGPRGPADFADEDGEATLVEPRDVERGDAFHVPS